jgi:hypothetical protein
METECPVTKNQLQAIAARPVKLEKEIWLKTEFKMGLG